MAKLTIRTNNHWRELLSWHDLSDKEKGEYDWIKGPETSGESFFRYRKWTYCLSNFMRIDGKDPENPSPMDSWHGYESDSFFSGVVIRFDKDHERIQIGGYCS